MASRDSQGLQIALILFVMVSVVLAVMTFVFYRSAQEAKKGEEAAKAQQKTAQDNYNIENFKVQYLKHILGAPTLSGAELETVEAGITTDDEMIAIVDSFKRDTVTYGEGLPEDKLNYREFPGYLIMALRNQNAANTDLEAENARLTAEKKNIEMTEQQRTKQFQDGMQKARDDLDAETTKFKAAWDRMNQEKNQISQTYNKTLGDLQGRLAAAKKRDDQRQTEIKRQGQTIQKQKERITELVDEPFEVPDGRVAWVNQGTRTVWVNLGLADGLRRQTTFSVYDQEAMNVGPRRSDDEQDGVVRRADEAKGKIEVTRVLDQHLSEARIVDDYPANPIMPGDQVFSPAWKPGRRIRFALVGMMDIDGDRRSDRDLVRNIITMGGGVIDAEVHDDGTMEGELSSSTRYLVRGTAPTERRVLDAYSRMIGQAEQLGIQEINLMMLLDLMGYKAEVRTIGLGNNADPTRFKFAPNDRAPTSNAPVSEKFRERRPPARSGGSAF